jgi:alkylation response protein AidB-like acyl-CoA dehydrogenase
MSTSTAVPSKVDRPAALETLLGDPEDDTNPLGTARALAADAAGELHAEAEAALDRFGFNAEFVPSRLGGRLDRLDVLVRMLRPVFRRDIALGLGYGATTFVSAVNLWLAGSPGQQRAAADLLLNNGRLTLANPEFAHGNALARNGFRARAVPGGFRLNGVKAVINNGDRSAAAVVFARTAEGTGRDYSALLVDLGGAPPGAVSRLDRKRLSGVPGCRMTGLRFDDCPVPGSALLGPAGGGVELALRAFQVTHSVMPSVLVGIGEAALRTVVGYARQEKLFPYVGGRRPHAAEVLGNALTDLLIADCLALTAVRAVHVLPDQTSVYAAALKYLLPTLLDDLTRELSVVMGRWSYIPQGRFGIFAKHIRDMRVLNQGRAAAIACQATIVPQLHVLARHSWYRDGTAPAALFDPYAGLPPLDVDRLVLASGHDSVSAELVAAAEELDAGSPVAAVARDLCRLLAGELELLRAQCRALAAEAPAGHDARGLVLADRYVVLLAAAACVGVHRHGAHRAGLPADPAWLAVALSRLAGRLGLAGPPVPPECGARLTDEVFARFAEHRGYDLFGTLPGGTLPPV